jgi:hypothetical protein
MSSTKNTRLQQIESSAEESSRAVSTQLKKNESVLEEGVQRLKAKALELMSRGRRRQSHDDLMPVKGR